MDDLKMINDLELENSIFIESVERSREYWVLATFLALKSCNSSMSKRIVTKNTKEAKIIFRFLRIKINRERKKFSLKLDKMNFERLVCRYLPAYARFYDFEII